MLSRFWKTVAMATVVAIGLCGNAFAQDDAGFSLSGKPKIAFIYYGAKNDGGWTQSFDEARQKMEKALGLDIAYVENIDENAAEIRPPVERFIKRGYNIIIGTAFGYSDTFKALAEEHPDVAFLDASGTVNGKNLQSFYGRTYESFYLCGIAAGAMTKSNKLGFVGANPYGVVNWTVNGFEMGAQLSNPDAKTTAIFIGTWADPVKERAAAEALIDGGADVIGQHVDTPTPQIVAQERGVYGTGHHRDLSQFAPKATICSSAWVWDRYLTPEIKKIIAGGWKPNPYGAFPSFAKGPVDIVLNKELLPQKVVDMVMAEREKIMNGKQIYTGPIKDTAGEVKVKDGEVLDDAGLWNMDWYVPGVITQK